MRTIIHNKINVSANSLSGQLQRPCTALITKKRLDIALIDKRIWIDVESKNLRLGKRFLPHKQTASGNLLGMKQPFRTQTNLQDFRDRPVGKNFHIRSQV